MVRNGDGSPIKLKELEHEKDYAYCNNLVLQEVPEPDDPKAKPSGRLADEGLDRRPISKADPITLDYANRKPGTVVRVPIAGFRYERRVPRHRLESGEGDPAWRVDEDGDIWETVKVPTILHPWSASASGTAWSTMPPPMARGSWVLVTLLLSPRMPDVEFAGITGLVDKCLVIADRTGAELGRADITALRESGPWDDAPLPDITAHPGKAIGSGGSTGRSKIIVDPKPWARVPGNIAAFPGVGFRTGQVQLVAGPLYHNSPFSWGHSGLFEEQHLVVLERFDAARAVEMIERHRCQFMFLAPTMMQRIARLEDIELRNISSIESSVPDRRPLPAMAEAPLDGTQGAWRSWSMPSAPARPTAAAASAATNG